MHAAFPAMNSNILTLFSLPDAGKKRMFVRFSESWFVRNQNQTLTIDDGDLLYQHAVVDCYSREGLQSRSMLQ